MDGFIFIAWLGASAGLAYAAVQRGRSGVNWFLIGLLLSPLLALLVLLACPAVARAEADESAPGGLLGLEERRQDDNTCYFCGKEHVGERCLRGANPSVS